MDNNKKAQSSALLALTGAALMAIAIVVALRTLRKA